jgi:uncharacterized protein (DUF427 family)
MAVQRIKPGPGQESVWDYPRPPRLEPTRRPIRVVFNGVVLAETGRALRVMETSHPPAYYFPPEDVQMAYLIRTNRTTQCEWKGRAVYYSVEVEGRRTENAAWAYPDPAAAYEALRGYLAFYPRKMDACYVGDEQVQPQPGNFYGGWITSDVVGPFKGGTGTWGW